MNLETKRSSSRLCSRTISIQGTLGFSVLSCPHGTLNSGDGAREAQPMIRYSRQLGTYVRGWGGMLYIPGRSEHAVQKEPPYHGWGWCQGVEWVGSQEHCSAGATSPVALVSSLGAMLEKNEFPLLWASFFYQGHHAAHPLPNATFLDTLTPHCSPNLPRSQGQPFLAFCLHHD